MICVLQCKIKINVSIYKTMYSYGAKLITWKDQWIYMDHIVTASLKKKECLIILQGMAFVNLLEHISWLTNLQAIDRQLLLKSNTETEMCIWNVIKLNANMKFIFHTNMIEFKRNCLVFLPCQQGLQAENILLSENEFFPFWIVVKKYYYATFNTNGW